jgi:hypothetical protein
MAGPLKPCPKHLVADQMPYRLIRTLSLQPGPCFTSSWSVSRFLAAPPIHRVVALLVVRFRTVPLAN